MSSKFSILGNIISWDRDELRKITKDRIKAIMEVRIKLSTNFA